MNKAESRGRLTEMMFGLICPPASSDALRQGLVHQLTELEALRGGGLTEEEYAGWRADVLAGLADNRHPEPIFLALCAFFVLLCGGGLAYALAVGAPDWTWGMVGGLAGAIFLAWGLARGLRVKRRLSVPERLAVVEELQGRGLVSADEAMELRARIARLGPQT